MSILVYIIYVWFSNYWSESRVRYSIIEVHSSPLFYLIVLFVGGTCFLLDYLYEVYRYTYRTNGSDYVRQLIKKKQGKGFNDLKQGVSITEEDHEMLNK
jgi:hypothetical protein